MTVSRVQRPRAALRPRVVIALLRFAFVGSASLLAACSAERGKDDDDSDAAGEVQALVDIRDGSTVEGFASGRIRRSTSLPAFQISKYPVTRGDYQACVAAGRCSSGEEPGCDGEHDLAGFDLKAKSSPVVCVGAKNAASYCRFIGGRLPTLAEWFYAARGSDPRLYAWGNEAPSCERHPRAQRVVPAKPENEGDIVQAAACATIEDEGRLRVGKHAAGASPFGLEDVLITPAELLATDAGALLSGCNAAFPACVVTGHAPGAIESVAPYIVAEKSDGMSNAQGSSMVPYSFRCVLEKK